MRVLLFFNELSCAAPAREDDVDKAMARFVGVLSQIARWRPDTALISRVDLRSLELAPAYFLVQWAGRPANRDHWRRIRTLQQRAPFSTVLPDGAGEGVDYFIGDQRAEALAAADLLDGVLVSLMVEPTWDSAWIEANRQALEEGADGEPRVEETQVQVRHAATLDHAAVHEEHIKRSGLSDLSSGGEIWEERASFFPNLMFLPRTERDLRRLRVDWVLPVARELRRLDEAIARWDPKSAPEPDWSDVDPEGETRKRLCWFEDFDGHLRCFDQHARFNPGVGRIHLALRPEQKKATIAYIGKKLGI